MTSSYSSPKHHSALTVLSYICIVCDHAATFNFFSPSFNPPAALISWSYSLIILAGFFSARFWHGSININLAFIFPFYITFPQRTQAASSQFISKERGAESEIKFSSLVQETYMCSEVCPALTQRTEHWHHFLKSQQLIVFRKTKQSCTNYG